METSNFSSDDVSMEQMLVNYTRSGQHLHRELFKLGLETYKKVPSAVVPAWALFSYLIMVNATGVVLNGLVCVVYYFKKNKKGIHTLILQVVLSDLLTLTVVSVPELWSHQSGNWTFGKTICRLYLVFEVFASTSNIYFLIAINLHALASVNSLSPGSNRDSEELLENATELRSSRRSLVSRDGTLTHNRQNDQKNKNSGVPVLWPLVFVWVLSAALSAPELPLSTVIDSRSGISMCTFMDGYHLTSMQILLSVFQLFVPFLILSATSGMIVFKLIATARSTINEETRRTLQIALFLCATFLVFSIPRFLLSSIHGLWSSSGSRGNVVGLERFVYPPLNYSDVTPTSVPLALSFLHFLAPVVRPMGYFYFFTKTKGAFCCGNRRQRKNLESS